MLNLHSNINYLLAHTVYSIAGRKHELHRSSLKKYFPVTSDLR